MDGTTEMLVVHSECGHPPVRMNAEWCGVPAPKNGDYGLCWCDKERERKVVLVERETMTVGIPGLAGPEPTPDTLDDWLERWPTRKGPATEPEVQRLVDALGALRDVLDHALVHWKATGRSPVDVFAGWEDGDWADSGWTEAEQRELRAAINRVNRA